MPAHGVMGTSSPVRLVLFDVDGTLVDHDGATAAGVEQWRAGMGWTVAELPSHLEYCGLI